MCTYRRMTATALLALLAAVPAGAGELPPLDVKQSTTPPAGVKARGAVVEDVWSWSEGAGIEGHGVFSITEKKTKDGDVSDRYLYVQLYRGKPGALKELRLVQDKQEECEGADITADFVAGSVAVTDEDADGKVELSFAYDIACRTDVSPATRKLLVLEASDKHILRGTQRVDEGSGQFVGGEYEADGFKNQSKLLSFAEARWKALLGN